MDPGLYPDMTRSEYDAELALNYSTIKLAHEKSLMQAYEKLVGPGSASTPDQIIGNALHTLILEPELFTTRFAPMPVTDKGVKLSRTTQAGAVAWDRYDDEHGDKHPIKRAKITELMIIRENVMAHPTARAMIENASYKETSFFWDHPEYNFECKAQFDLLTEWEGWTYCTDLKSTKDASPAGFEREIAKYSYMIQDVWYREGLNEIAPADRRFAYIAFEKTHPFPVCVYELDALNIFEGKFRCDSVAAKWDKALDTGEFPGYPGGVNQAAAKRWAMDHERAYDEEIDENESNRDRTTDE